MDRKRILIVDDDPTILSSMQYILKDAYEVTTVAGGQEALTLIEKELGQIDLIICDLSMPVLNGASLYLQVANQFPALTNHFIFMTGGVYGGFIEEFSLSNENHCLKKPFDKKELLESIETFFQQLSKT